MRSIAPETPFGSTIFCDDIRHEIGGKVSLIGIYRGSINVHQPFPITMSKFAFAINYSERPGESTEEVRLGIYLPGDPDDEPSIKANVPVEAARSATPDPKIIASSEDPVFTITLHTIMEGLVFKEEGRIKVRAYRGDLEIKMGTIFVQHLVPPSQDKAEPT